MKNNYIKIRAITIIAITIVVVGVPLLIYTLMHAGHATAAWYNDSWNYRVKLTIDHTKVGADQTDFPVYVDLAKVPSTFFQHVQSSGADIRVTKGDGTTELPREVVSVSTTAKTGELYVKYSGTLSSSTDTSIYIYYGNSTASDYAASATYGRNNVWSGSFVEVQHLKETSGTHVDSTSNSNNSTSVTVTQQGAQIGKLYGADEFNGSSDIIAVGDASSLRPSGDMTVETWVKLEGLPLTRGETATLVHKNGSSAPAYLMYVSSGSNDPIFQWTNNSGTSYFSGYNTPLSTGTWYHLVGVKDSGTLRYYFNGSATGTNTDSPTGTAYDSTGSPLRFGSPNGTGRLYGMMDEIRISSVARSATWISTEYNNENSPSTFFLSGAAEEQRTSAVLSFNFDEGYGTTAHDSSPNGYVGTLSGSPAPSWQTEDQCISGKCLYYNGSTAYTSVTTSVPNVQSVSFWVKPKTNGETLVDFDGGTHYISASAGSLSATNFSSPLYYINGLATTTPTLTANVWQHIEITTATAFTATNITIGKSTAFLNGYIDEFKVYDYARTSDQVKLDYNARTSKAGTAVRFGPDLGNTLSNGLVGYWKMDENTGTSTVDSSGNGNNSTTWTGATWAAGKFGSATSYNGTDQVVRFAETASTDLGATTDSYTVSAWINFTSCANVCDIVDKMSNSSAAYPFHFYIDSTNMPYFSVRDSSGNVSTAFLNSPLTAGSWYHISAVRDVSNDKVYLYVNGIITLSSQTATDITSASAANNDDVSIGNGGGSYTNNDFNGKIDDVRIYKRAMTPSEIGQLYNWAPGPVGWWKMDEASWTNDCSTATVMDSSGNGNNGKSCPASTGPTGGVTGKFGKAGSFDGTNDYIDVTETSGLPIYRTTGYSVAFWVKGATSQSDKYIFSEASSASSNQIFIIGPNNANLSVYIRDDSDTVRLDTTNSTSTVFDNTWHYVEWTDNNGAAVLYVDGVKDATSFTYTPGTLTPNKTAFGAILRSSAAKYFTGYIDDVKTYNYVRTPSQVLEDMNAGHPAPGGSVGSAVGWWKMDEGADNTCSGGTNDVCNSGSGGSTYDLAQNNMSVPATSTSGWTSDGKLGKALSFDNSDDYLSGARPMTNTDDWALSAWVNPRNIPISGPSGAGIVVYNGNDTGGYGFGIGDANGANGSKLVGLFGNVTWIVTSYTFPAANSWYHIVMTRRGGTTYFYVNGVEQSTTSTSTPVSPNAYFTIGAQINATTPFRYFNGKIDEVRVFSSALTGDQVKLLYNQSSEASFGALSTDSSGNASNSDKSSFCPPGNTEGNCGGSNDPSPVAYWKLDENTGTTAYDSSGNGNNSTTWTGATWTTGKYGSATSYNGNNQVVRAAETSSTDLGLTTDSYTVSAWIKTSASCGGTCDIVSKMTSIATAHPIHLFLNSSNQPNFDISDGTNGPSIGKAVTLNDGKWHFIVGIRDVSSDKIYIYSDVINSNSTTDTTTATAANNADISFGNGGNSYTTNDFNGQIDDVRIYHYVRTAAQIAWDYNRGAPTMWYKFDECTGATVYNSALNANGQAAGLNGTIVPNTGRSTGTCNSGTSTEIWNGGTTGKFNASVSLDGAGDYVDLGDLGITAKTSSITYAAWIKTPDTNGAGTFITDASASHNDSDMYIQVGAGNIVKSNVWDGSDNVVGTRSISANTWHHVAVVIDRTAATRTLYVDGAKDTSDAHISPGGGYTRHLVGIRGDLTDPFAGQIDDVRIYNYPLSQQQILTVMNQGGAVRFGPNVGSP